MRFTADGWLRDHPCSTSFEQWMKLQNKRK